MVVASPNAMSRAFFGGGGASGSSTRTRSSSRFTAIRASHAFRRESMSSAIWVIVQKNRPAHAGRDNQSDRMRVRLEPDPPNHRATNYGCCAPVLAVRGRGAAEKHSGQPIV